MNDPKNKRRQYHIQDQRYYISLDQVLHEETWRRLVKSVFLFQNEGSIDGERQREKYVNPFLDNCEQ